MEKNTFKKVAVFYAMPPHVIGIGTLQEHTIQQTLLQAT